ncbi:MAG TPA: hydroxymethylbilane synthase [Solirubrobacteraceae bacterium]
MRIGTRGSALALAQARLVAEWLGGAEIVVVRTRGDIMHEPRGGARSANGSGASNGHSAARAPRRPQSANEKGAPRESALHDDKSRWVAELEHALSAEEIDLAVHSAKDIPVDLQDGLELLGSPSRAAAEDALIGARSLEQLPEGACVGTSSVRRAAQLRAARSDLEVVSLRGNIDTRLRKLAGAVTASGDGSGGSDASLHAIILAKAGLQRLQRERDIGCTLDAARFVPAPGQGALGLQARAGDSAVSDAVAPILDKDASACLLAERALAHALGASCNTPLGAHAAPAGCGCLHMHAWVGLPDGSEWIADEMIGGFYEPKELGVRMAERLAAVGARELLARAEELGVERD